MNTALQKRTSQHGRQEIIRIFTGGKSKLTSELPRRSWAGSEVRNARRYGF